MTGRGGVVIVVVGGILPPQMLDQFTLMNVGICKVRLRLPGNHSLKGKRGVIKSVISRVAARFDVSIAEVDELL